MKLYPNVVIIICIWALSLTLIFFFGFSYFPHIGKLSNFFWQNLGNWDGGHYLAIAEKGYTLNSDFVFFPLYPILIHWVSKLTGNYLISGILISLISIILAANIFYQIVLKEFGKSFAEKALLALLFFPLSFHFITIYTESLFFLLTILAFLFLRNKRYFLATVLGALASATRLSGLAVVLSLILTTFLIGGLNKKNWLVLLSPLGLIIYCVYLYQRVGDPFYFTLAEANYWHKGLVLPGSALLFSFKQLLSPNFIVNNFRNLLDFIFAIFGILTVWQVFKKLSLDYAIFAIFSLLLPLFSPTIVAIPRYLLSIFPIFIVLSFSKNQYFNLAYQIICLMLLPIYAIFFLNGYWVS